MRAAGPAVPSLLMALRAAILTGLVGVGLAPTASAQAQVDSTMAQDGVYDRPFIGSVARISVGGYVEGNTNYFVEEGIAEGFSMELRRFNLFVFSQVSQRIRFLSELEFEHGTEEIALETAQVDFELSQAFVLRAGIILPPLGFFNQNHDSPRWDFVERPLVSTAIIPSTLSEVGGGAYGRIAFNDVLLSYDAYVTNGLGDGVLDNDLGRTDIASGKSEEQFGGDNNGSPSLSARIAGRVPGLGELGISHYRGYYNTFRTDGVEVDERRGLAITALDFGGTVGSASIRGEAAYASIDVPDGLAEIFGDAQWGGHLDVTLPVWHPRIAGYEGSVVAVALRVEHLDFNRGSFSSTGSSINDDVTVVVPGLSFRPAPDTVFRLNYRYQWTRDLPGNAATRRAGVQVGLASYF